MDAAGTLQLKSLVDEPACVEVARTAVDRCGLNHVVAEEDGGSHVEVAVQEKLGVAHLVIVHPLRTQVGVGRRVEVELAYGRGAEALAERRLYLRGARRTHDEAGLRHPDVAVC